VWIIKLKKRVHFKENKVYCCFPYILGEDIQSDKTNPESLIDMPLIQFFSSILNAQKREHE